MIIKTRRKYSRHFDNVPILYAGYESERYNKAVMRNCCLHGMYFESDSPLRPTGSIFIKIQTHQSANSVPESYKAFRARVIWSHQLSGGNMPCYGTGVQFTAKSHFCYGINKKNSGYLCDYCESEITSSLIHRTETGLTLCKNCLLYMETLPSIIVESVERFLMANVI